MEDRRARVRQQERMWEVCSRGEVRFQAQERDGSKRQEGMSKNQRQTGGGAKGGPHPIASKEIGTSVRKPQRTEFSNNLDEFGSEFLLRISSVED
jgi:hypothetical protein